MSAISEHKCATKKEQEKSEKEVYGWMSNVTQTSIALGNWEYIYIYIAVPRNLSLRPSSGPWQWPLKCTFISPTAGRRWLRPKWSCERIKGQLQIDQLPRGADGGCSLWKRDRLLLELICDYCGKVITRTRVHLYLGRSQLFMAIKVPGQTERTSTWSSKMRLGECASY